MRNGEPFSVDAFNEENLTHSLVQRLHTRAFGRGLVQPNHLRPIPKVSTFLRDLTRHTRLEWEEVADKEAAEICHRSGWIHSYMDEGRNYYTFSSPLHSVIISWFLMPSNDMSQCPTAFELSCGPLQLQTFYRSLFLLLLEMFASSLSLHLQSGQMWWTALISSFQ